MTDDRDYHVLKAIVERLPRDAAGAPIVVGHSYVTARDEWSGHLYGPSLVYCVTVGCQGGDIAYVHGNGLPSQLRADRCLVVPPPATGMKRVDSRIVSLLDKAGAA